MLHSNPPFSIDGPRSTPRILIMIRIKGEWCYDGVMLCTVWKAVELSYIILLTSRNNTNTLFVILYTRISTHILEYTNTNSSSYSSNAISIELLRSIFVCLLQKLTITHHQMLHSNPPFSIDGLDRHLVFSSWYKLKVSDVMTASALYCLEGSRAFIHYFTHILCNNTNTLSVAFYMLILIIFSNTPIQIHRRIHRMPSLLNFCIPSSSSACFKNLLLLIINASFEPSLLDRRASIDTSYSHHDTN